MIKHNRLSVLNDLRSILYSSCQFVCERIFNKDVVKNDFLCV